MERNSQHVMEVRGYGNQNYGNPNYGNPNQGNQGYANTGGQGQIKVYQDGSMQMPNGMVYRPNADGSMNISSQNSQSVINKTGVGFTAHAPKPATMGPK
jgi:hypothetical protein